MGYDLSQFHAAFFDEAREHLENMERLLLSIDVAAPESEDVNAIFRAAHSIKGGSGTFGFPDMAGVTHVLESLLDRVRHGELPLSNEIVDASLQACDVLSNQLACHRAGTESDPNEALPVVQALTALMNPSQPLEPAATPEPEPAAAIVQDDEVKGLCHEFRIEYRPETVDPVQTEALREELARLGSVSIETGPTDKTVYRLSAACERSAIEDILSFVAVPEQYLIEQDGVSVAGMTEMVGETLEIEPPAATGATETFEEDGFGFFVDPAQVKAQVVAKAEDEDGYGFFVDLPAVPGPAIAGAPPAANPPASAAPPHPMRRASDRDGEHPMRRSSDRDADTSIRVSVEKVDQLINLIGELVITHAMLAQTISRFDPVQYENLFNGMAQLERNSRDMQEAVMSIRMLPIGSVFSRFPRLVRDLAGKLGKQVELKLVGENTELDKGLIERLADPLTHLVRNSLDHGIETPDARLATGKAEKGLLTLQAYHQGGNIIIEVRDDGAGLNRERIVAKAVEQGIPVNPDAPDSEIWPLIFAPGFSTAEAVTDVSGRGVGMDVVKRNIEGMGGRVEITSQRGYGTCIAIRLPLTLAILDGMSIGVGDQVFILPLSMIVESLQPKSDEISPVSGRGRVVHVRGEYLPLVALHEVFGIVPKTADPCEGICVILEVDNERVALLVDELLGQHQVVIKSLETNYRKVRGVSGATIMGDGRVALIVDVAALVQLSRS